MTHRESDDHDAGPDEEQLARLIAMLPPAPEHTVAAAHELPATLRALAEIDRRVLDGAVDRAAQTAELAAALDRAGVAATPERIAALERRLLD